MNINCSGCAALLNKPGSLLFSPPDELGMCYKQHFCDVCRRELNRTILRLQAASHGLYPAWGT